jgi:hypothetical protein
MGSPKESLVKKNIFTEKYDEIRRLDGLHRIENFQHWVFYHFIIADRNHRTPYPGGFGAIVPISFNITGRPHRITHLEAFCPVSFNIANRNHGTQLHSNLAHLKVPSGQIGSK